MYAYTAEALLFGGIFLIMPAFHRHAREISLSLLTLLHWCVR
jgi:hypothetical protein